ncbi:MAG TPA: M28 family peptidase [Bacteroidales bacterium]|nr:M28 family peptidase [Bacteroidales bacterium]HQK68741.1 M28 family peptidase [Bacteroidales bacterium]
MNYTIKYLISTIILLLLLESLSAQKKISGSDVITSADLESYVSFLASPLLKGRKNSEPGLEIAQQYIISQAKILGLKPANGTSYLQPYSVVNFLIDNEKSMIQVIPEGNVPVTIQKPIYQIVPTGPSDFTLEGDVVFAGYGLKQERSEYDDFAGINPEGKILLVMLGSPPARDGKGYLLEDYDPSSFISIQLKLTALLFSRAKAIIIVPDPKSGYSSLEEKFTGISGELNSSKSLKGEKPRILQLPNMPKMLFVHREVADELLKGTGYTLEGLQNKIDSEIKPFSFNIKNKKLKITEVTKTEEVTLNNVAALIEGSDPLLKNEYVVYSAHADHIGESARGINTGADDDASGCAALLSIAEAFQSLEKKPLRSILFLWVSGEEIGLFGSKYYSNNPLVPLDKTVADLNVDMIGRVKGVADTSDQNPMSGPKEVFVITDDQSKELRSIAESVDASSVLDFNYELSGTNHPLQLFSRSDHYNFVVKDIPVLFFSTGLHTDYHTPRDITEKIDFSKMELIARTMYEIGYNVANRKTRIVVDNPFSSW